MEEQIIAFFANKFNGDDGAVLCVRELLAANLRENVRGSFGENSRKNPCPAPLNSNLIYNPRPAPSNSNLAENVREIVCENSRKNPRPAPSSRAVADDLAQTQASREPRGKPQSKNPATNQPNSNLRHFPHGDSAARELVFSKDLFVENAHFKRGWLTWREVGAKAVAVNLSDAVAMNATPIFALLGLGLPRDFTKSQRDELCGGVVAACAAAGVEVIGGDTVFSPNVVVSLTIISRVERGAKPLFRTPSKRGDIVFLTGERRGRAMKKLAPNENETPLKNCANSNLSVARKNPASAGAGGKNAGWQNAGGKNSNLAHKNGAKIGKNSVKNPSKSPKIPRANGAKFAKIQSENYGVRGAVLPASLGASFGALGCSRGGSLGESKKALDALLRGGDAPLKSRFRRPILRAAFAKAAARFMRCAMDLSDGLASDLPKISRGFGVKFAQKFAKFEFVGGEEYELLFTAPRRNLARLKNEAKRARIGLFVIGQLVRGKVKTYGKFSHF